MNRYLISCLIAGSVATGCATGNKTEANKEQPKPNIIYILADDLGYGDLSCYGQQNFQTPNIDLLAKNGLKFTQHYSGSTVCAPSRSALLTGQDTGHTPIRGNKEYKPEGQEPIPATSVTVAEVMKQGGYVTGAFGKWGLGFIGTEGDANNQGFDEFYGYNCQRMAHRYYPPYLWHNDEKVELAGNDWKHTATYGQDLIHEKALEFIESNKDTSFFAYVPYVAPHAELIAPNDSILAKFKGQFDEKPYVGSKGADYGDDLVIWKYCSQETPKAAFAAMIYRLDVYVGQIVEKLEELGIADNTIIMFASDNGPHQEGGAEPDFFNSNGGLKGYKRDLYEGGIRSPFIVYWPEKIKQGRETNHISAFWDVLPTCADIAGVKAPEGINGISMLPTILDKKDQVQHEYLYWEFHEKGGRQAVRLGKWKGVVYNVNKKKKGKLELYDLSVDQEENNDLAAQHPDVVERIEKIISEARTESSIFTFKSETLSGM